MRLITLEKNASDLSLEISKLKQGIASGKEGSPQADLALVIDLTLELNRKLQLIESLTKQLISLTGTSAIISDKDLVLSNFTVPRNFYIRSKGSLKLESPVQKAGYRLWINLFPPEVRFSQETLPYFQLLCKLAKARFSDLSNTIFSIQSTIRLTRNVSV